MVPTGPIRVKTLRTLINIVSYETYIYSTAVETARALIKHLISLMEEEPQKIFHTSIQWRQHALAHVRFGRKNSRCYPPWSRMRIYWVDERCVPAEDSESNYGNMRRLLLDEVGIPGRSIFFLLTAATIPMMRRIAILA